MSSNWFNVDKAGLAAILERRGKFFAIAELLSNAWDSGATAVSVELHPIEKEPYAVVKVNDNGDGFANLDEATTMFARSRRAGDAEKRGRFNMGEKLVLALCRSATINTTCGSISFKQDGKIRRTEGPTRERGTLFMADIKMTRDEYAEIVDRIWSMIPPVETSFNGEMIGGKVRPLVAKFLAKFPTEIADGDGVIRRTVREANVEVYRCPPGVDGLVLELGVPVVETESGYAVNVLQKIPLGVDRDNVSPAFLRTLNAHLLNHVAAELNEESVKSTWVQEAAGSALATSETVHQVVKKQFGERAVVATPNDPIANANAAASGFTLISGGALSGDVWGNVRKFQALKPASAVFPTPTADALADRNAKAGTCPACNRPL